MTRCVCACVSGDNCGIHFEIVLETALDLLWCDQVVSVFVPVVTTRLSNVKDDAAFRYCTTARHPLDPMSVTIVNWRDLGWECMCCK